MGEDVAAAGRSGLVRVWDPFVRIFHWGLAASFLVAYLTRHGGGTLHYWAGAAAAALVALRLVWGIVGTHYARFTQFVRGPAATLAYLRAILDGREARHIGHNPAGGAMIVALLAAMLATATTGYLQTTDQFFGDEGMQKLHDLLGNGLLLLVLGHLAGVALTSLRHRENLVRAMVTGFKRPVLPEDHTCRFECTASQQTRAEHPLPCGEGVVNSAAAEKTPSRSSQKPPPTSR